MKKIGRNELCPCGSGLKFKKMLPQPAKSGERTTGTSLCPSLFEQRN